MKGYDVEVDAQHRYIVTLNIRGEPTKIVLPSVTTIIGDMGLRPGYEQVPPEILETAGQRGTTVHELFALMLQKDLHEASVDERLRGYYESLKALLPELHLRPVAIELRVVNLPKRYAGTIDVYGPAKPPGLKEGRWVFDVKTRPPEEGDGEQLVGYVDALRAMTGIKTQTRGAVIRAYKDGKPARVYPYDLVKHRAIFSKAVDLWWVRRARRLV